MYHTLYNAYNISNVFFLIFFYLLFLYLPRMKDDIPLGLFLKTIIFKEYENVIMRKDAEQNIIALFKH